MSPEDASTEPSTPAAPALEASADAAMADATPADAAMATTTEVDGSAPEPREQSRWSLFAVTVLLMGATTTLAQVFTSLALSTFGLYDWRLSTGGLLAIVAGLTVGRKRRTWSGFWRRVWPWLIAAIALAATITVSHAAQRSLDTNPSALAARPSFALMSQWEKIDVEPEWSTVSAPTGKMLVEFDDSLICSSGQPWFDCLDRVSDNYDAVCLGAEVSRESLEYTGDQWGILPKDACAGRLIDLNNARAENANAYSTTSGAGWNKIVATPEMGDERVQVVYEESHVALCFLGIFGECR